MNARFSRFISHCLWIACAAGLMIALPGCSTLMEYGAVWPPEGWSPSEYGSFSPDVTSSYDGRYSAVQTLEKPEGKAVNYIRVTIFDAETDAVADTFLTERAMDFWGVCWEPDSYNLWIQSGDVGTYCMCCEEGHWFRETVWPPDAQDQNGVKYKEVTHLSCMPDGMIDRFRMRNGSFEYDNARSASGRYYAQKDTRWNPESESFEPGIGIYNMSDNQSVFFYPLSEEDDTACRGVCWERGQDHLWVRLDDEVFCLRYEDGTWRVDNSAKRPDYIALAYNFDGTIRE